MDPILSWWDYNMEGFVTPLKAEQENLFKPLLLGGGSGTGKTETGRQIPRLINEALGPTLGFTGRTVKYVQTFSFTHHLQFRPTILDDKKLTHEKPPRNQQDMDAANHAVAVSIAASYFLQNGDYKAQVAISKECPQLELEDVISAIRHSEKMSGSDILVLFVHIDEFQNNLLGTLSTLRAVGTYLSSESRTTNTLIATILSGTYPTYFSIAGLGATEYNPDIINIPPMQKDKYRELLEAFLNREKADKRTRVEDLYKNEYFPFLLEATGGIPEIVRLLCTAILRDKKQKWDSISDLSELFDSVVDLTRKRYPPAVWMEILQEKKYVMKFLKHEHFGESVTKSTLLNRRTIGEIETSGVIFLEGDPDYQMQLKVPLFIKSILVKAFELSFYGQELLNPFSAAYNRNEDIFPLQVLQIHRISAALLTPDGETPTKVSLNKFYRNSLKGNPKVLEKEVEVQPNPKIRIVKEPWRLYAPEGDKITSKDGEIFNWKEGNYYVLLPKRTPGQNDAFTPFSREQYKYAVLFDSTDKTLPFATFEKEVKKPNPPFWEQLPLVFITPKRLTDDFWRKFNVRRECAFVSGEDCVDKLFKDFVLFKPTETGREPEAGEDTTTDQCEVFVTGCTKKGFC